MFSHCTNFENKNIVHVYWNNDTQWESAKIVSVSQNNEITIMYLENEIEDTININDNGIKLRLKLNQ